MTKISSETALGLMGYAELIKLAYEEGFCDYETNCNPMRTFQECWLASEAKIIYDKLVKEANDIIFYG